MADNIDECISEGGRITTKTLSDTQYVNICTIDGKSFEGRVRDKKTTKEKRRSALKRKVKRQNRP